MPVTCDDLGSGSSPTFANSPTFESTLNLALTCTLHKPEQMSRFAPHRSSNSNPQDSVPAEGSHDDCKAAAVPYKTRPRQTQMLENPDKLSGVRGGKGQADRVWKSQRSV